MTEAEARKLLNVRETEEILNKLREELKEIKDPQLRRKALNRLNAPAYAARISRLEALREQIYAEMAKVSDKEIETTGKVISKSYEHTYYRSIFDTQVGTGFAFPSHSCRSRRLRPFWAKLGAGPTIAGGYGVIRNCWPKRPSRLSRLASSPGQASRAWRSRLKM